MPKILSIFGTRPEAIKMAPVLKELEKRKTQELASIVCVTAQHREMLDSVLNFFSIQPDHDLDLMRKNQTLAGLTSRAISGLDEVMAETKPDFVLVQGDTTTAMAGAVAAFYRGIPVAHIEAGLRTYDLNNPFPEEFNRRTIGMVAQLHFSPTEHSRLVLEKEGVASSNILVTGNTVIDAVIMARDLAMSPPSALDEVMLAQMTGKKMILVTAHRRESIGKGIEDLCFAIQALVEQHAHIIVAFPIHLNPKVQNTVRRILGGLERVWLLPPQDYPSFVWLMKYSYMILSDSGGVQEEAPALNVPVLVTRSTTERPEGVSAGCNRLVGTRKEVVIDEVTKLLFNANEHSKMAQTKNPYGSGQASNLIVDELAKRLC